MLISDRPYQCIQGEGELMGTPSILVRTSTCNLRCKWGNDFCDTPYSSWNPEINLKMTPQEILEEVQKLAGPNIRYVIISGGEPTTQYRELKELCDLFISANFHITIETNGTRDIYEDGISAHLLSISPKLQSSTPFGTQFEKSHSLKRFKPLVLNSLLNNYTSYLKFVVSEERDILEILMILQVLSFGDPHRIFLMPEGVRPEQVREKSLWVVEQCKVRGFRYSPRLHLDLYGVKRGV